MLERISKWLHQFFPQDVEVVHSPSGVEIPRELTNAEKKAHGKLVCKSKVRYYNRDEAWKWAIYYRNALGTQAGVYRCHYCQYYHLSRKVPFTPSRHTKKKYNQSFYAKPKRPVLRKEVRPQLRGRRVLDVWRKSDGGTD